MRWQLSTDVDAFIGTAGSWLRRDPVANTVILTAVAEYRAGHRWSSDSPLFGWCGRDVRAAMCRFPPYELALTAMSAHDARELANVVASHPVPSVRGPVPAVEAFSACQVERGATATAGRRQRLYRLTELHNAPRPARGVARPAEAADVGVVARWLVRFAAEAGSVTVDRTAWLVSAVRSGLIWLWCDHDEPVAVACRHATVESVSRVGPVYTPPEHRRRGYGTAVAAAVTADALAGDAAHTALFADLANPTANGIYAALGYEPVHEIRSVRFDMPS